MMFLKGGEFHHLLEMAGGAGGLGFRMATCDEASWTAKAQRQVAGSNNLNLTACLFQYKDGYHLNLYAVFTKQEGGLMQISRDMAMQWLARQKNGLKRLSLTLCDPFAIPLVAILLCLRHNQSFPARRGWIPATAWLIASNPCPAVEWPERKAAQATHLTALNLEKTISSAGEAIKFWMRCVLTAAICQ